MKAKGIVSGVLLAFVAVSIAVAVIKETVARPAPDADIAGKGDTVVVYYLHTTFRCATCNRVEATAEKLIRAEFATAIDDGRLVWKSVDFQEHDDMAVRYEVGGNMIVVARMKDGKEVGATRLTNVMDLAIDDNWTQLADDVRSAVGAALEGK